MIENYFFLSGLQRSGSTLLGSLLNQNPKLYVSPTSPLLDLLCLTESTLQQLALQYTYDVGSVSGNVHRGLFDSFYKHIDKPYVMDKHRGWSKNINTLKTIGLNSPKVVCTYRPICENITSFIKLAYKDPDNAVDSELRKMGKAITDRNRAQYIWEHWTLEIYDSLKYGLDNNRESILIVHYNDLVNNTQNELDKIYGFIGLPTYQHKLTNIVNTCAEQKDEIWGFEGLHDVRPAISYDSWNPEDILDKDLLDMFAVYDSLLRI